MFKYIEFCKNVIQNTAAIKKNIYIFHCKKYDPNLYKFT